jgi:RNA polymerase sigma-70 factor (ECF subfamily)
MEKTLLENSEDISGICSGDMEAFVKLVKRYQSPIVNYLYRLTGDSEVARDLAQDTFVQAFKGLNKATPVISFKAWLYRIATNNALQYLRRKASVAFIPLDDDRRPGIEVDAAHITEVAAVHETLLKVPEKMRVCMVLHYVNGFKHREIARMLGISEDAVRMRVARGSEEFRRLYSASGGDVS